MSQYKMLSTQEKNTMPTFKSIGLILFLTGVIITVAGNAAKSEAIHPSFKKCKSVYAFMQETPAQNLPGLSQMLEQRKTNDLPNGNAQQRLKQFLNNEYMQQHRQGIVEASND